MSGETSPASSGRKSKPSKKPAEAGRKLSEPYIDDSVWYRLGQTERNCERTSGGVTIVCKKTQRVSLGGQETLHRLGTEMFLTAKCYNP
jgi:hypothetical protein